MNTAVRVSLARDVPARLERVEDDGNPTTRTMLDRGAHLGPRGTDAMAELVDDDEGVQSPLAAAGEPRWISLGEAAARACRALARR